MKEIEIGGQKRPVKYNINALIEFEELTGIDVVAGLDAKALAKIKNMRALAFVGLKHGHLENSKEPFPFSIDDVGKWIGFGDGSMNSFYSAFNSDSSSDTDVEELDEEAKK
jgi:ABC-type thiamine transport system substrate-binding protein